MKFIHLTPTALVFLQFGALAVGMASWLDDDEGTGDSGDGEGGGSEFEMDDDFDDDFDDEFGSFDDMDGGGAGGGDSSVNELEHRLEELETEVSNVSSKANTVRSENEQISESVEDVEENVRKLLEIYEMVTRGVNPFVDDVETDALGGGGEQSFGLFDDEEAEEADEEDLDSDIADADADEFFEDDAFDDFEDGDDEMDDFEDGDDEMDDFEDGDDDIEGDAGGDESDGIDDGADGEGGDGTSFEELKEEYESGDADWTEGEDVDDDEGSTESELGFDDSDLEDDEPGGSPADESGFEFESEPGDGDELAESSRGLGLGARSDGPHLEKHPDGYLADVVSLEWLDYLLTEFGPKNTVRTLNYYERIGWIGEPAREQLFEHLEGLTDSDYLYRDEFGTTELTMDDHLESLDYIEELASEDIERVIVDRCEDLHRDGIQR